MAIDGHADAPALVTFKKRGAKASLRKRPATPPPASDSSSEYSSEDEAGRRVKRRKKTAVVTASTATNKQSAASISKYTQFAADRSATIDVSNDATRQSNWYDEKNLSAQSLLGKTRSIPEMSGASGILVPDGTYKGTANYSSFISKARDAPTKQVGPVKAPTNVRTIVVTDYSPDVCKDYKQTGFCGFGDNCKFLHAREDYKQGWALDKEWEVNTKGKFQNGKVVASANKSARMVDEDQEDAALLEKIPFACVICKKSYTNPILTRCGHYFCEACALQRYKKRPDCAVCGAGTNGLFNGAKGLNKILERKKQREEKLKIKEEQEKGHGNEEKDAKAS